MFAKSTFLVLFSIIAFNANAQKLPSIQQIGVRAPANIKIDGKAKEWNNKFQANNHGTDTYYTISNDDNNLYLTIQAVYPDAVRRILNGGITFTVSKLAKKKDDPLAKSVTYPVFMAENLFTVNFKAMPEINPKLPATVLQADSFMNINNKRMNDRAKWIKTSGLKDVDTLISVYNTDGIKAAATFDNKMVYTCELSIALKRLDLSVNNAAKFTYHMIINEVTELAATDIKRTDNGHVLSTTVNKGARPGQVATDLWGEYTLVKK